MVQEVKELSSCCLCRTQYAFAICLTTTDGTMWRKHSTSAARSAASAAGTFGYDPTSSLSVLHSKTVDMVRDASELQALEQHMEASHPLFSYSFLQSHSESMPAVNVRCPLEAHKGGETFNGDFLEDRNAMSKVCPRPTL